MICENAFVFMIVGAAVAFWILYANIEIAVRLRRFRGFIDSFNLLGAQFGTSNECFSDQYKFDETQFEAIIDPIM